MYPTFLLCTTALPCPLPPRSSLSDYLVHRRRMHGDRATLPTAASRHATPPPQAALRQHSGAAADTEAAKPEDEHRAAQQRRGHGPA